MNRRVKLNVKQCIYLRTSFNYVSLQRFSSVQNNSWPYLDYLPNKAGHSYWFLRNWASFLLIFQYSINVTCKWSLLMALCETPLRTKSLTLVNRRQPSDREPGSQRWVTKNKPNSLSQIKLQAEEDHMNAYPSRRLKETALWVPGYVDQAKAKSTLSQAPFLPQPSKTKRVSEVDFGLLTCVIQYVNRNVHSQ